MKLNIQQIWISVENAVKYYPIVLFRMHLYAMKSLYIHNYKVVKYNIKHCITNNAILWPVATYTTALK